MTIHKNNRLKPLLDEWQVDLGLKSITFDLNEKERKILQLIERYPDNPAYHIGGCVEMNHSIDLLLFAEAMKQVHETTLSLRIVFNKDTKKVNCSSVNPSFFYESIAHLSDEEQHQSIIERYKTTLSSLSHKKNILYQVKLLRLSSERFVLIIGMHHLISDGFGLFCYAHKLLNAYMSQPIQNDVHAITHYFHQGHLPLYDKKAFQHILHLIQKTEYARFIAKCDEEAPPYQCMTHTLHMKRSDFSAHFSINCQLLHLLSEAIREVWQQEYLLLKINNHARHSAELAQFIAYIAEANIFCAHPENSLASVQAFLTSIKCADYPSYESVVRELNDPNKMPEICYNYMDFRRQFDGYPGAKYYPLNLKANDLWADEIKLVFEIFAHDHFIEINCYGLKSYFKKETLIQILDNVVSRL